jgi:hypothetical protein
LFGSVVFAELPASGDAYSAFPITLALAISAADRAVSRIQSELRAIIVASSSSR